MSCPTERRSRVCNASRVDSQRGCPTRQPLGNGGGWGEHPPEKKMLPSTYIQTTISADSRSKQSEGRDTWPEPGQTSLLSFWPEPGQTPVRTFCSLYPPPLPSSEEMHLGVCRGVSKKQPLTPTRLTSAGELEGLWTTYQAKFLNGTTLSFNK